MILKTPFDFDPTLLDFTGVEGGTSQTQMDVAHLARIVSQTVEGMQRQLAAAGDTEGQNTASLRGFASTSETLASNLVSLVGSIGAVSPVTVSWDPSSATLVDVATTVQRLAEEVNAVVDLCKSASLSVPSELDVSVPQFAGFGVPADV